MRRADPPTHVPDGQGSENELHQVPVGIDALLPEQIAHKAESSGAEKARMPFLPLMTLSILAGAFIAFGALFAMAATVGGAEVPQGFANVLGGLAFSLALVLVIVGGAELFTSNNLMVMALVGGRITTLELLHAWIVIYIGNLMGAVATGGMAVVAGISMADGNAIGLKATQTAADMADLGMVSTFFAGLLGNVLVCLAVWISYSGRTTTDRMLAVSFPITAFYALGLEHVIATMFYFPFAYFHALATGASQEILSFAGPDGGLLGVSAFLAHLGPVTAGNIVGGGALVGVVYWFIYRRGVYRRA